ncbi:response regulator [Legionella pneumophila serogroup 10]
MTHGNLEMTQPVEVVLIEDNPLDAELTINTFKKNNIINEVRLLKDGQEAVDYFFKKNSGHHYTRPRVILLDLSLPKVPGLDVLKKLKSDAKTKSIPVVVLTSSHEDKDIIECYRLGVNSYIVKPIDFEKFVILLTNLKMYWVITNQPTNQPTNIMFNK